MMKKLLILLMVLILAAGFAFAQEEGETQEKPKKERAIELFNWEFFAAFPVHWSNGMHNPGDFYPNLTTPPSAIKPDRTVTANIGLGSAFTFNFTKKIGLTLDFDFFYGTKLVGTASDSSDSVSMLGVNAFLGPVFYIVNSDRLRVPISIGAHVYYYADEIWMPPLLTQNQQGYWMNRTDLQIGVGLMIGIQFHFDNSIYLFSRTSVYFDFIRMHKVEGILYDRHPNYAIADHMDMLKGPHWSIKPAIGLGIKW